jgi:predicted GTPase
MDRRRERSCKWREISAEIPEFWVANMTPSEIKAARESDKRREAIKALLRVVTIDGKPVD